MNNNKWREKDEDDDVERITYMLIIFKKDSKE